MDQESIVLEVDPRSVLAAIRQANQAVEGWEKQTIGSGDKMQKSLDRMADMLLKMNDKSRSSIERLTQSIEKQAAAYGKTGVDRLIADRDRIIKKLGDEQGMIDRVTASYAKMIDVESGKSGGSFQALGRNIEGFLRDPLNASKEAATGLLEKIGPMGGSLAIGATALAAVATAGWEAAKSLGEYGVRVKDAELRTGLTAKEVGQFSFAAKAVGQDISLVERMMRGLTNALTENTSEGEKARTTLRSLGVSTRDELGNLRPTAEILQELGEGLNRLPDAIERNRAAMDIFKRAGIEAVPMITELTENLRIAREQGFGPTEDDIRRFTEYQRDVAELETKWDSLMRKFKEGLVTTLSISIKWIGAGVKWFLDNVGTAGDDERERQEEEDARQIAAAGGIGAKQSLSAHRKQQAQMEQQAPEIMRNRDATLKRIEGLRAQEQQLTGDFGILQAIAPTDDEIARMKKADQIHKEIDSLQQMLDEAGKATRRTELKEGRSYILAPGNLYGACVLFQQIRPTAIASELRREVSPARPGFRVTRIRTQEGMLQAQTVRERLLAMLALFFAAVALLLAGVGLYGVLNYSVFQRRRKMGIRMAIRAQAGSIVLLVTVEIFTMVLAGALVGGALSISSVQYIRTLLYQVRPTDWGVLALPLVPILTAGLVAALPAAVRAVQIDPVNVLRSE